MIIILKVIYITYLMNIKTYEYVLFIFIDIYIFNYKQVMYS